MRFRFTQPLFVLSALGDMRVVETKRNETILCSRWLVGLMLVNFSRSAHGDFHTISSAVNKMRPKRVGEKVEKSEVSSSWHKKTKRKQVSCTTMTLTRGSSSKSSGFTCSGCNKPIKRDRFLLRACDKYWHENCLRCDRCHSRLGELGSTLYCKANMNLCRQDYLEMFGETGVCSVCEKIICSSEMVMRAKQNVYHLECFACQLCSQRFCVGDRFYLCENKVVCQYDYEENILPIQRSLIEQSSTGLYELNLSETREHSNHLAELCESSGLTKTLDSDLEKEKSIQSQKDRTNSNCNSESELLTTIRMADENVDADATLS